MNFGEFRNKFGGQDRGLHQTVSATLQIYRQEADYPKYIDIDDIEGQYTWIFKKIDSLVEASDGFKHKIASKSRLNKPESFINLVRDWARSPLVRSKKRPTPVRETEPLMVFYYFSHLLRIPG